MERARQAAIEIVCELLSYYVWFTQLQERQEEERKRAEEEKRRQEEELRQLEEEEKRKLAEMQKLQEELERDAKAKEEEEARLKREAEDAFAIIGDLDSALKVSFCTSQTLVAKLSFSSLSTQSCVFCKCTIS